MDMYFRCQICGLELGVDYYKYVDIGGTTPICGKDMEHEQTVCLDCWLNWRDKDDRVGLTPEDRLRLSEAKLCNLKTS